MSVLCTVRTTADDYLKHHSVIYSVPTLRPPAECTGSTSYRSIFDAKLPRYGMASSWPLAALPRRRQPPKRLAGPMRQQFVSGRLRSFIFTASAIRR